MDKKNTLVFSIATNGYDEIFEDCIDSQKAYCTKYGYEYTLFNGSSPYGIDGTESAWMKIPLMVRALEAGYDWVVFLDADCLIKENAPDFLSVEQPGKHLYLAKDARIEQFNTGVIVARNKDEVKALLKKMVRISDFPHSFFPKKFQCLYEMGHFNYVIYGNKLVERIDQKWNNNSGKEIGEYVWHGAAMFHRKPRAKQAKKRVSKLQKLVQNLRKRPRVLRLKKQTDYFWNKFHERHLSTNL